MNASAFAEADLRGWLTHVASDELQGRQAYTEGIGLAGAYIARNLEQWGVAPAGDNGSYFQTVRVLGMRARSNSSVTVTVKGQSRTFKDGEGVTFPRNQGGKQTVSGRAEFVGHGVSLRAAAAQRLRARGRQGQGGALHRNAGAQRLHRHAQPAVDRARPKRHRGLRRRGGHRTVIVVGLGRRRRRRTAARQPARGFSDRAARGHARGAADHRQRRILQVRPERLGTRLRRAEVHGRAPGGAAGGRAGRRHHLDHRRRGLRRHPDAAHPQRRRHGARRGCRAGRPVRDDGRALRPHRLPAVRATDLPGRPRHR